jgi:hypothetical protein
MPGEDRDRENEENGEEEEKEKKKKKYYASVYFSGQPVRRISDSAINV